MRLRALATDYDDTLATDGALSASTVRGLEALRRAGVATLLVTGRVLADLREACPRLELFDRVVAENGATLYRPDTGSELLLANPLPERALEALRARGVPLFSGRVIVATYVAHSEVVRSVFAGLGLVVNLIPNRSSLMLLPPRALDGQAPVDKRSGLQAALAGLHLSLEETAGVGDAQNDLAFVSACGLGVAVQNALPELQRAAHWVTSAPRGAGVEELIARLLAQ